MSLKKRNFEVTTNIPELPDIDTEESGLNLFDQNNPDINLFNLVDDEIIKLSGSKMYLFKYNRSSDFDEVYMESRNKPISKIPIIVHGHYEPDSVGENLTNFGIELTSDQLFIFNKSYIERKLGRAVIPGDVIRPFFQNHRYEIYQVTEDSFEAYGIYHLVCNAKLLRDNTSIQDIPYINTSDPVGGVDNR